MSQDRYTVEQVVLPSHQKDTKKEDRNKDTRGENKDTKKEDRNKDTRVENKDKREEIKDTRGENKDKTEANKDIKEKRTEEGKEWLDQQQDKDKGRQEEEDKPVTPMITDVGRTVLEVVGDEAVIRFKDYGGRPVCEAQVGIL